MSGRHSCHALSWDGVQSEECAGNTQTNDCASQMRPSTDSKFIKCSWNRAARQEEVLFHCMQSLPRGTRVHSPEPTVQRSHQQHPSSFHFFPSCFIDQEQRTCLFFKAKKQKCTWVFLGSKMRLNAQRQQRSGEVTQAAYFQLNSAEAQT